VKRAFTLIEMLTVLGISAVILTIIIIPMIQSYNFAREAEGLAEAQERGRILIEHIARDISNGAGVADNTGLSGDTTIVVPGKDGTPVAVHLRNARLDILKPAQGDPITTPGSFTDPDSGRIDPTLRAPKGQMWLPAAPGSTLVRYFVGLRRPLAVDQVSPGQYFNPYEGVLAKITGAGRDNLFVLYRAEVQPFVFKNGSRAYNDTLFREDPNHPGQPYVNDPNFFVQDPPDLPIAPQPERLAQAKRIQNWLNQSVVVTEDTRYDMILPVFNRATKQAVYDGNVPRIISLIQFHPEPANMEPTAGEAALARGTESDITVDPNNPQSGITSDVHRTSKGAWTSPLVQITPYSASPGATSDFLRADMRSIAPAADYQQLEMIPGGNPANAYRMFDLGVYDQARSAADGLVHYPFSEALASANASSNWLTNNADKKSEFIPFSPNFHAGEIYTSFGIEEVGNPNGSPKNKDNAPQVPTSFENGGTATAYTPQNDPNTGTGNFYDATFASINEKFNKVWQDFPNMRPNVHRFIDLRRTPQLDKWASPMDPAPDGTNQLPWASNWTGFDNVTIVPGSEVVIGPDQNPGPGYGQLVRYTRVTGNPGPDEYRINYTNLLEPADYSVIDPDLPAGTTAPATYDPTNIVSAVLQPRYKVGYIQFDSDPNVPLPAGVSGDPNNPPLIHVSYRFQFNRPADTIAVDYDSREAIDVLLTVRNFPTGVENIPQTLTLQASAPVRNFLR